MFYKEQSGRTMLEMLGVLAIMGIIIYGAVSSINYGMASYRVNRLYVEIPNIIKGIQDMYLSVYGRNSFPDRVTCNTTEHTDFETCKGATDLNACKYCQTLLQNDILTKDIHNMVIDLNDGRLTITLHAGNADVCERLTKMDWIGESITCKSGATECDECGDHCCSAPYELVFSPK